MGDRVIEFYHDNGTDCGILAARQIKSDGMWRLEVVNQSAYEGMAWSIFSRNGRYPFVFHKS